MDKKDLLTDIHTLLKKHNIYLQINEDEIAIIEEGTNKPIQSFYDFIDAEGLYFRLCDMEIKND